MSDDGGYALPFCNADVLKGGEMEFTIQFAPRDMSNLTVTEIHQTYGWDVAEYVIQLRSQVDMWKRIATNRAAISAPRGQE